VEDRKSRRMIAVAAIAVAPTGKASFVYSYVQTRLMGQYSTMENDPLVSFVLKRQSRSQRLRSFWLAFPVRWDKGNAGSGNEIG